MSKERVRLIVPVTSPRLQWSSPPEQATQGQPEWVYQENNARVFTATPGAWVALTFRGSAISYRAFHNTRAARIGLQLDNHPYVYVDGSAGMSPSDTSSNVAVLWSVSGLSPGMHTLNATLVGRGSANGVYMDLVNFEYTLGPPAVHSSSAAQPISSSSSAPPAQSSSTQAAAVSPPQSSNAVSVYTSAGRFITVTAPSPASTIISSSSFTTLIDGKIVQVPVDGATLLSTYTISGAVVVQTVTVAGENGSGNFSGSPFASNSNSSAPPIGAIVGGVLGAACLVLILLVLALRRCRQIDAKNRIADARPLILQPTMHWDDTSPAMDSLVNLTVDDTMSPQDRQFHYRNGDESPDGGSVASTAFPPEAAAPSAQWMHLQSRAGGRPEKGSMPDSSRRTGQSNQRTTSFSTRPNTMLRPASEEMPPPPYHRS